jgi:hypothetical protein
MGVVAALTLQAAAAFEEMAHLCLVNALRDTKLSLSMSKTTILTYTAETILCEGLAELRLF